MYIDRLKAVVHQLNQLPKLSIKNGPCTPEEIAYFEKKLGLTFPKAYEEYLLWDGRNNGIFFTDYASADDIKYNRETVNEMLQEVNISENIVPDDAIIFYVNNQAYCFAFIRASEGDNPPVHFFWRPGMKDIQWNYSNTIEEFRLQRVIDRYRNLAADAIASLDFEQPNYS